MDLWVGRPRGAPALEYQPIRWTDCSGRLRISQENSLTYLIFEQQLTGFEYSGWGFVPARRIDPSAREIEPARRIDPAAQNVYPLCVWERSVRTRGCHACGEKKDHSDMRGRCVSFWVDDRCVSGSPLQIPYSRPVDQARRYAYVFCTDSDYDRRLRAHLRLRRIGHSESVVGDWTVRYAFEAEARPRDVDWRTDYLGCFPNRAALWRAALRLEPWRPDYECRLLEAQEQAAHN